MKPRDRIPFEKLGDHENFVPLLAGMRMPDQDAFACHIFKDKKWFDCGRTPSPNAEE
jgi:hypothetical protein